MTKCIVLLIATAALSLAQQVVFRGVPGARVFSTPERDDRQKLEPAAAQKAECVIVLKGKNKYYWASRGDAPLNRVDTPEFTFFIHPQGLGFVKVFTGERAKNQSSAEYIESFTRGFEVITYWGKVLGGSQ